MGIHSPCDQYFIPLHYPIIRHTSCPSCQAVLPRLHLSVVSSVVVMSTKRFSVMLKQQPDCVVALVLAVTFFPEACSRILGRQTSNGQLWLQQPTLVIPHLISLYLLMLLEDLCQALCCIGSAVPHFTSLRCLISFCGVDWLLHGMLSSIWSSACKPQGCFYKIPAGGFASGWPDTACNMLHLTSDWHQRAQLWPSAVEFQH